jgi:hypothetical protein
MVKKQQQVMSTNIDKSQPITTYSLNKEILTTYSNVSEQTINTMIQQLDYGNFDEAVRIKNKLLQDDRLAAVINSRAFNLLDSSISVAADQESEETDLIEKSLNTAEQEIKNWYITSLLLGAGLLQIIYTDNLVSGKRTFKLQNYEPYGLRYDLQEDLYFLITSYKNQDAVEKDKRIAELKNSNGYASLAQYKKNYDVEIITGNPKWILCELGSRGFRNGLIRSIAWTYLSKQLAIVAKNKWSAKTAGVIKKLMVPAASDPAANKAFARSVKNMMIDDVVTLPQSEDTTANYDVTYLEAGQSVGTAYQAYQQSIDSANADYAISVLSNNLTTQVVSGSLAAAETHSEKENKLAKSDKEFVQAILNDQLLGSYKLVNNPNIDCKIVVNKDTEAEIRDQLDLLSLISNVNENLSSQGLIVDLPKLIAATGIDWVKAKVINIPIDGYSAAAEAPEMPKIELAPTDLAKVITVDEARASQGLSPLGGEMGKKMISELGDTNANPI